MNRTLFIWSEPPQIYIYHLNNLIFALQHSRIAVLQHCTIATLQHCNIATLQHCSIARFPTIS
ncbi:MAG: hypothetical protein V9E90_16925 [Saprospiraceae bacterium]